MAIEGDSSVKTMSSNLGIGILTYTPEYFDTKTYNVLDISGNIMSLLHGTKSDYAQRPDLYTQLYGYDFVEFLYPLDPTDDASASAVYWMYTKIYTHNLILPSVVEKFSYAWMFGSFLFVTGRPHGACIATAPQLPATLLKEGCYYGMFCGNIMLTQAPDLLATYVPNGAYAMMFWCAANISYIKMLATSWSLIQDPVYQILMDPFCDWVSDVAETGTFVKKSSATLPTGDNGIPDGWTVQNV